MFYLLQLSLRYELKFKFLAKIILLTSRKISNPDPTVKKNPNPILEKNNPVPDPT